MDRPVRTVVIGAGIGGLATAIRLAHAGHQVTVVDLHDAPGGKMRTLPSAAGPVDAGPTVMTMRPVFARLFADVGDRLENHVTLHPETILARHIWPDGSKLDLFADAHATHDAIGAFAGAQAQREFAAFNTTAKRLFDGFDRPMMQAARPNLLGLTAHVLRHPRLIPAMAPGRSLAQLLARHFTDPRLRQLFGRYATYLGGSPMQSPAVLALIWQSEAQGVWRVEGGMHRLPRAMHDLAVRLGATFHFGQAASHIVQQGGRVTAVYLADGTQLPADIAVFNGDPKALHDGLLGTSPQTAVKPAGVAPRSLSAFVWAFAAQPDGVPLAHHNIFFAADPVAEFNDLAAGRMPADPTLYVCAQDRGGLPPKGLERFEIIMNGPAGYTGGPEEIETCRTRTFETLHKMGLRFSPAAGPDALTTPSGFNRLFPASDGSLYGRSPHGMMAAFQRPTAKTSLPGLYLAGGGVHPGAGIPMACLSGQHAAAAILSDLASTLPSRPMAMPGGMSTGSATMASGQSRSSAS